MKTVGFDDICQKLRSTGYNSGAAAFAVFMRTGRRHNGV